MVETFCILLARPSFLLPEPTLPLPPFFHPILPPSLWKKRLTLLSRIPTASPRRSSRPRRRRTLLEISGNIHSAPRVSISTFRGNFSKWHKQPRKRELIRNLEFPARLFQIIFPNRSGINFNATSNRLSTDKSIQSDKARHFAFRMKIKKQETNEAIEEWKEKSRN